MTEKTEIKAEAAGHHDGAAAASWYFDGNTPRDTYVRVLTGIEDGDPAILDTFPAPPRVSGDSEYRDAYECAYVEAVSRAIESEALRQVSVS